MLQLRMAGIILESQTNAFRCEVKISNVSRMTKKPINGKPNGQNIEFQKFLTNGLKFCVMLFGHQIV